MRVQHQASRKRWLLMQDYDCDCEAYGINGVYSIHMKLSESLTIAIGRVGLFYCMPQKLVVGLFQIIFQLDWYSMINRKNHTAIFKNTFHRFYLDIPLFTDPLTGPTVATGARAGARLDRWQFGSIIFFFFFQKLKSLSSHLVSCNQVILL